MAILSLNVKGIHNIGNMKTKIKKNAYVALGECIVTDQVPAHKVAMYFDDEDFLKWYRKKYFKKHPGETSHKDWLKGYWKWKNE